MMLYRFAEECLLAASFNTVVQVVLCAVAHNFLICGGCHGGNEIGGSDSPYHVNQSPKIHNPLASAGSRREIGFSARLSHEHIVVFG